MKYEFCWRACRSKFRVPDWIFQSELQGDAGPTDIPTRELCSLVNITDSYQPTYYKIFPGEINLSFNKVLYIII